MAFVRLNKHVIRYVMLCQGDDGDKPEVGGGASAADDAAADADESTPGTADGAHQQQRHIRQRTETLPVSLASSAALS